MEAAILSIDKVKSKYIVTGVPSAHYRHPGNQRGSPARPHHGLAGHT